MAMSNAFAALDEDNNIEEIRATVRKEKSKMIGMSAKPANTIADVRLFELCEGNSDIVGSSAELMKRYEVIYCQKLGSDEDNTFVVLVNYKQYQEIEKHCFKIREFDSGVEVKGKDMGAAFVKLPRDQDGETIDPAQARKCIVQYLGKLAASNIIMRGGYDVRNTAKGTILISFVQDVPIKTRKLVIDLLTISTWKGIGMEVAKQKHAIIAHFANPREKRNTLKDHGKRQDQQRRR